MPDSRCEPVTISHTYGGHPGINGHTLFPFLPGIGDDTLEPVRPAVIPTHMPRALMGFPADKACWQVIVSITAFPKQVRLRTRSEGGANLLRAVLGMYYE